MPNRDDWPGADQDRIEPVQVTCVVCGDMIGTDAESDWVCASCDEPQVVSDDAE